MEQRTWNVLFICTGNTSRSILAEGLLNHLGKGRFRAFSGGSFPKGVVNPYALRTLDAMKLPIDGYRSKSWDEFSGPGAPHMDFVFTVCDDAAGEVCPVWPGQPTTAHWGVEDPAAVEGTDEQKMAAFHKAAMQIKSKLDLFVALPIDKLDRAALKNELHAIGSVGR